MKKLLLGLAKKFKRLLPPARFLRIYYEYYTGKPLNLEDPREFNAKIQWMKLYYRPPILNQLVDKYAVRDFVKNRIGPEYLNEVYAVYRSAAELDLDALPQRFVLKGTHGYNQHLLVRDKRALRPVKVRRRMRKWLRRNHYYRGGLEWAYKDVEARVMAEKYLEQQGKASLDDYKYYCFSGSPKMIQVDLGRGGDHKKGYFSTTWEQLPLTKVTHALEELDIPKPKNLEKMTALARKLSEGFPFVRVDFYNIGGKILFGEMTFYPGDGRQEFYPDRYNAIIGSYLELPELQGGQPIRENPPGTGG